ncbi:MAG: hypothetical protein D6754_11635 [Alphaproteobacteria bacterium]|nr:MAG: hypothetical protein D6754_11635 [Alphaproteobacteria bacterium]
MHEAEEDSGTVFRDVIMLTLLGFVTIVVLMLPHLNPPKADDTAKPAGNIVVEARWADGSSSDVDLWVQGPGDKPVGYSRKNGELFDLLRDDLGTERDLTGLNYEFAFSRGAPAGEYIVNLHLYSLRKETPPVSVEVAISLRNPVNGTLERIASRRVELNRQGEEITVQRFRLDANGALVRDSLNRLPKQLRSVK